MCKVAKDIAQRQSMEMTEVTGERSKLCSDKCHKHTSFVFPIRQATPVCASKGLTSFPQAMKVLISGDDHMNSTQFLKCESTNNPQLCCTIPLPPKSNSVIVDSAHHASANVAARSCQTCGADSCNKKITSDATATVHLMRATHTNWSLVPKV